MNDNTGDAFRQSSHSRSHLSRILVRLSSPSRRGKGTHATTQEAIRKAEQIKRREREKARR